jgi:hypothetical protein
LRSGSSEYCITGIYLSERQEGISAGARKPRFFM